MRRIDAESVFIARLSRLRWSAFDVPRDRWPGATCGDGKFRDPDLKIDRQRRGIVDGEQVPHGISLSKSASARATGRFQ
jgi:hypothetical protein